MAADTHLLILVSALLLIGPPYMAWVECSHGGDSSGGGSGRYHDVAFIESPQYSVALPGDSVYFNCRTNLPASLENITWLHNGRPLPWKLTTGGKELKQTGGMFTNFLICSWHVFTKSESTNSRYFFSRKCSCFLLNQGRIFPMLLKLFIFT